MGRLTGSEGCDFKQKEPNNPKTATWLCEGSINRLFAKVILEKMGNIDIEASFKYFEDNGGHCDCEIVFNVDPEEKWVRSLDANCVAIDLVDV